MTVKTGLQCKGHLGGICILVKASYDILGIVCINLLLCVLQCMLCKIYVMICKFHVLVT